MGILLLCINYHRYQYVAPANCYPTVIPCNTAKFELHRCGNSCVRIFIVCSVFKMLHDTELKLYSRCQIDYILQLCVSF